MLTLTTTEAAEHLGCTEQAIRNWVMRGQLAPVRPGAKPSRYRESDLIECHAARRTHTESARLDARWQAVLASTPAGV